MSTHYHLVARGERWKLLAAIVLLTGGLGAVPVRAEVQPRARRTSGELVREALSHEIAALGRERQRLLDQAVKVSPDFAPAHWHQGEVRLGNQWRPTSGAVETESQQRLRELYEERRSKAADTPEGQLALADWCAKHGLAAQVTAHLNRVIQLAPDQATARQRLGFERLGNRWVHRQDLWQGLRQPQQTAESLRKWQKKLDELVRILRRSSTQQTAGGLQRLKEGLEPDAVPAIEIYLGNDSEPAALAGVELLGHLPAPEASAALTRLAVLSPWPSVRAAAGQQLQARPRDHYVPLLLAELSRPIESQIQTTLVDGRIVYRHQFVRETQQRRENAVLDTVMVRPSGSSGDGASEGSPSEALDRARALTDARATAYAREWERLRQNRQIESANNRIAEALSAATGQSLPADPQAWWSWWDAQNEVSLAGDKPYQVSYRQDLRVYARAPATSSGGPRSSGGPSPGRNECFVAGTPVWTIRGTVTIECIRVGDLVLSQDPDSGELAYQPVLQTTQRPPEPLVKVRLAARHEDVLEGSGGHPLWVSGEGWINLRHLKSGQVVHGIDGGTVISDVEETAAQPTYNLVVDRFHTYVVGAARVLCHDNTPRRPTSALVPGLTAR